ncbi:MAG: 3-hydroxyacyl-ACP dehydratase [Hydrogenophaga sp.]|nr:3-hydroxyacyl-ACP dehydratase [Hydrogenophaga sp.]MDO9202019.1 3-hydroxyacyl-ACP dehydratase [Hydrogenophaga sp.]MDP3628946.1 3-hydroxyacyl-ACP dehydratase [Hydrogenophaga sp.]MDZ4101967.1 3-hydroxyacyl-ACP dehydratase [Hydrogenophaga sp.]MDZ4280715.1 3-hydroxyacyl-ACP dehydratase [Hydrogenophaga sp.]
MDTVEFIWAVPPDHPAFAGHFPGRPIVPGVVLLDQALLFAAQMRGEPPADGWQVAQAKFFVPVGPGQTLRFALRTTARGAVAVSVTCEGVEVATGSLVPPAP